MPLTHQANVIKIEKPKQLSQQQITELKLSEFELDHPVTTHPNNAAGAAYRNDVKEIRVDKAYEIRASLNGQEPVYSELGKDMFAVINKDKQPLNSKNLESARGTIKGDAELSKVMHDLTYGNVVSYGEDR